MSGGLKITFLVHAVVAFVFGIVCYLRPVILVTLALWPRLDANMTRTYGAALLAIAISSWLAYRATRWEEVRILVQMEIGYTVLSTVGGLWGLLFRGAPPFGWVPVVLWVAFAAAWIYFYVKRPTQA